MNVKLGKFKKFWTDLVYVEFGILQQFYLFKKLSTDIQILI